LPDQPEKLKVSRGNQIGPIPFCHRPTRTIHANAPPSQVIVVPVVNEAASDTR